MSILSQPLTLPCGVTIKNRIIKAAMTEGLADVDTLPNERHNRLYKAWAEGGSGVLITGNVMVDGTHLERPGNVVLDHELNGDELARFRAWAEAGSADGCQMWMQISHTGRQTQKKVNPHPKSASDVALSLPGGQFAKPTPLEDSEIEWLIGQYANAADMARQSGFHGVQIHGAHGYLISQFLSPAANRREDKWGGSLENRARFLRRIVEAVREKVGPQFVVSVKLNSSDFQKGAFEPDDARQVVAWLESDGVDLVELSGGTYEQPKMLEFEGLKPPEEMRLRRSTREREAFFQAFAAELREETSVPLMVTGGFRSREGMEDAIEADGIAAIGVGRPTCGDPDCVASLLDDGEDLPRFEKMLGNPSGFFGVNSPVGVVKVVASFGVMAWYYDQIVLIGDGKENDPDPRIFSRFFGLQAREGRWIKGWRKFRKGGGV